MLVYEAFIPMREIPRKTHVVHPKRMVVVTKGAKDRLAEVSNASVSQLLLDLENHGLVISSAEPSGGEASSIVNVWSTADQTLIGVAFRGSTVLSVWRQSVFSATPQGQIIACVNDHGVEMKGLATFEGCDLQFFALWSEIDKDYLVVVVRKGVLAEVRRRKYTTDDGAMHYWNWRGAIPTKKPFLQSYALAKGLSMGHVQAEEDARAAIEDAKRVQSVISGEQNSKFSYRYCVRWQEPGGEIDFQYLLGLKENERPEDFLDEAKALARGDTPTSGCTLYLEHPDKSIAGEWEIDPWINSGYLGGFNDED